MMQEQYVSFETAKLLKQKGFNAICLMLWFDENHPFLADRRDEDGNYFKNSELKEEEYSAPTQAFVMKWLRENHNLFIEPTVGVTGDKWWYDFDIIPVNGRDIKWNHYVEMPVVEYGSPEEAIEVAIKYCLENLV